MKRIALTALSALALLAVASVNAQVYEWKDDKGKTHYSDKPPAAGARAARTIDAASTASGGTPQLSTADRELEYRKRQKDAQDKAELTKKEQAAASEKNEACDAARRHLETLESGERIALRDERGERYYLDDEQRQQETAKARQFLQSTCKP